MVRKITPEMVGNLTAPDFAGEKMDNKSKHFQKLFSKDGELVYVQFDAEIWAQIAARVEPVLEKALTLMYPQEKPEPLAEWQEFKDYWDFKYPFEASVECQNCGAKSEDWENDPAKPFRFKSASLSGLAIFQCRNCQATIRKKHFKDHILYECSTGCGCSV